MHRLNGFFKQSTSADHAQSQDDLFTTLSPETKLPRLRRKKVLDAGRSGVLQNILSLRMRDLERYISRSLCRELRRVMERAGLREEEFRRSSTPRGGVRKQAKEVARSSCNGH